MPTINYRINFFCHTLQMVYKCPLSIIRVIYHHALNFKKKSNPQQKCVRKVKMNLFGGRIYIIYIPCSNFEWTHRKYIFCMGTYFRRMSAVTIYVSCVNIGKQPCFAFQCIFSIVKIIQQSYKSVYNWKFPVLWYIFQAKSELG